MCWIQGGHFGLQGVKCSRGDLDFEEVKALFTTFQNST